MYLKENLHDLTPLGNRLQDIQTAGLESSGTHVGDETAGADGVVEAHPLLVVGVVAAPQEVLVALVVGALIQHPAATFPPRGTGVRHPDSSRDSPLPDGSALCLLEPSLPEPEGLPGGGAVGVTCDMHAFCFSGWCA